MTLAAALPHDTLRSVPRQDVRPAHPDVDDQERTFFMSATALPPAPSRRLPRWTNNLLVIAIGIALALLALQLLPRAAVPLPQATTVTGGGGAQLPDALELGRRIAGVHLFGDEAAVEAAPAPAPEEDRPPEDTRLNLSLAGVFAADPQSQAIAIISVGNAEQNAYGVGDKISGEASLKSVHADHVIIDNRGKDERLALPDNVQPVALTPVERAPVQQTTASAGRGANEDFSQPVELPTNPGELRDTLARNPAMLGRVVAAEPYQENGKLVGYRITPKQNPEILEAQGIVAGDVITRVNNIQLNSQKQGIRALRNAVKAQNLEVIVLRDGIEVPISISLAQ